MRSSGRINFERLPNQDANLLIRLPLKWITNGHKNNKDNQQNNFI